MPSQRAPDIYVPMLTPLGHGYPLWLPDPPSNHPLGGTQIGDLGYLDNEGGVRVPLQRVQGCRRPRQSDQDSS